MKLPVLTAALLLSSASAFTPPSMTFAVGKKAPAKVKAAVTKPVAKAVAKAKAIVKPAATKAIAKVAPAKPVFKKPVAKVAPQKVVLKVKAATKPVVKAVKPIIKAAVKKPIVKQIVKAVSKPAPKPIIRKAAPIVRKATPFRSSGATGTIPSKAIPYELAPALLDGSLVGDVGFDPCFLSTKADTIAPYFNNLFAGNAPIKGLTWYREAELMHGRICMVAVLGFIVPGFGTFSGNDWTGINAYSYPNPLEAAGNVPSAALFQIFSFMAILEFRRINIILDQGANYMAGDSQRWGQGAGRWNPLKLDYTSAEYEEKQLQEVKHARLAMIGLLGLIFQANASGVSVVEQWSTAFTSPEYYSKAGYFLPEGI